VLAEVLDSCATNYECDDAYPDLWRDVYELGRRMNERPVTIPYGQSSRTLNGDDLLAGLGRLIHYDAGVVPLLPLVLNNAAQGSSFNLVLFLELGKGPRGLSDGMHMSVMCADDPNWSSDCQDWLLNDGSASGDELAPDPTASAVFAWPDDFWSFWNARSDALPGEYPGDGNGNPMDMPVSSTRPTLILNGQFDPVTPPGYGSEAARYLSRSTVVTFPNVGHGVLGTSACAEGIVTACLASP